jgi:uncharacterized protein (DUF2252 family)
VTVQTPQELAELRATPAERAEQGRSARSVVSRSSHRTWDEPKGRPDPVTLLEEQNAQRVPWLVPLRHGRMSVSPFTFYRGTARIMASDLASMPNSGLSVQLGGDAHLSNFGGYASPERQLLFDANDFDETLPGPFEWDLKRLATSFTIAAQDRGFSRADGRKATAQAVESYRTSMIRFADMGYLERWYEHLTAADAQADSGMSAAKIASRLDRFERKARTKTSMQALQKLTIEEDGRYRIRSDAPVLFPLRDLPGDYDPPTIEAAIRDAFDAYKETLADDRRCLLDRYTPVDFGVKVVGVGSVGTRCFIVLLEGRDRDDPLFLQVKEAGPSVLEEHLSPSVYDNEGRRVVEGQRLTQAQSDIFLGWTEGGIEGRHYYVRQLRDWKGSADIEGATPALLTFYAQLCGMTMARGHARSGDPIAIAAYMGKSTSLDRAITDFAEAYSAQNLSDYRRFHAAIDEGRLEHVDPATYDTKAAKPSKSGKSRKRPA